MKLLDKIKVAISNWRVSRQIKKAEKEIKENPGINKEALNTIKKFSEYANVIDEETKELIKECIQEVKNKN